MVAGVVGVAASTRFTQYRISSLRWDLRLCLRASWELGSLAHHANPKTSANLVTLCGRKLFKLCHNSRLNTRHSFVVGRAHTLYKFPHIFVFGFGGAREDEDGVEALCMRSYYLRQLRPRASGWRATYFELQPAL